MRGRRPVYELPEILVCRRHHPQMELHRIEARSERMAERLELLGRQTERSQSMDELQTVTVEEAASLMAVENREWWALLSFQDVKLQA